MPMHATNVFHATDVFFVLGGLYNGKEGAHAVSPNGNALLDGWYWIVDKGERGPLPSREAAQRALQGYTRVSRPGVTLLGYTFHQMTREERVGFAGAPDDAMVARPMQTTMLIWCPSDMTVTEVLDPGADLSLTPEGEEERCWSFRVVH